MAAAAKQTYRTTGRNTHGSSYNKKKLPRHNQQTTKHGPITITFEVHLCTSLSTYGGIPEVYGALVHLIIDIAAVPEI
jgi:hypothetical protein